MSVLAYYPPLQAIFVSPLTTENIGRGVSTSASRIDVMWSSASLVDVVNGVCNINHIVPLIETPYVDQSARNVVVHGACSDGHEPAERRLCH